MREGKQMPLLISMFFVAIVSLALALHAPEQEAQVATAIADVGATSVLAYRVSVVDYLNSNASFVGTVPDSSLTPLWGATRDSRWTNLVVAGGALYVYETSNNSSSGVISALYEKTGKSIYVGRNMSGSLVSANGFASGITVPAGVPDGSITIFGK